MKKNDKATTASQEILQQVANKLKQNPNPTGSIALDNASEGGGGRFALGAKDTAIDLYKVSTSRTSFGRLQLELDSKLERGSEEHLAAAAKMHKSYTAMYNNSGLLYTVSGSGAINDLREKIGKVKEHYDVNDSNARQILKDMVSRITRDDFAISEFGRGYDWWTIHAEMQAPTPVYDITALETDYSIMQLLRELGGEISPRYGNVSPVKIVDLYSLVMRCVGSFLQLPRNQRIDVHQRTNTLAALRRAYGATIMHFSRIGSVDFDLLEALVVEYSAEMDRLRCEVRNAVVEMFGTLSRIDWATSSILFDEPYTIFYDDMATGVKKYAIYPAEDEGEMPF